MSPSHHTNQMTVYPIPQLLESTPSIHELRWRWRNQRQTRKNRRRQQAAGLSSAHVSRISMTSPRSRSKYRPHTGAKQIAKFSLRLERTSGAPLLH